MINVQFAAKGSDTIVAVFSGPQDPDAYPNLGEVNEDDERYISFMGAMSQVQSPTVDITAKRDNLLALAAIRMAPLQDAVDLGKATDGDIAALTAWKLYRIDLGRLSDQPGYPADIEWPTPPGELAADAS